MPFLVNEEVKYRSFAGSVYDAVVTKISADGRVFDLDVVIPTVKERWPLKAVRADRISKVAV